MDENKIAIIGTALQVTSLAVITAYLPKNIQVATVDQAKELLSKEEEAKDDLIRAVNKVNSLNVEGSIALQNFYMPTGAHVAKCKHRNGNNSKRPKHRKKKRK